MDDIDAKQQTQIDKLEEHADSNRATDLFQWLTITVVAIGLLIYLNMGLVSLLNSQAQAISRISIAISERCGR